MNSINGVTLGSVDLLSRNIGTVTGTPNSFSVMNIAGTASSTSMAVR